MSNRKSYLILAVVALAQGIATGYVGYCLGYRAGTAPVTRVEFLIEPAVPVVGYDKP